MEGEFDLNSKSMKAGAMEIVKTFVRDVAVEIVQDELQKQEMESKTSHFDFDVNIQV